MVVVAALVDVGHLNVGYARHWESQDGPREQAGTQPYEQQPLHLTSGRLATREGCVQAQGLDDKNCRMWFW